MEDSEEEFWQCFAEHTSLQEFDVSEDVQSQSSYTGFKATKPDMDCLVLVIVKGIMEDYACDMLNGDDFVDVEDEFRGGCDGKLYA